MTNKGEIFYDGTCRFCRSVVNPLRPWLEERGITLVTFINGAAESEMCLKWHNGKTYRGADAIIFVAGKFWFTWPFAIFATLPGIKYLIHATYRGIAKNRHCLNTACDIDLSTPAHKRRRWVDWTVFAFQIIAAIAVGLIIEIPAWLWMWLLAGALWAGFKFMAFVSEGGFKKVNPLFFGWVGTDAVAFRYDRVKVETKIRLWDKFLFIAFGLFFIFVILPRFTDVLAIGWIGVAAMLCLFHFGGFSILAALWRHAGFPVEPIMNEPWMAKTLGEFWGLRWNRAFSDWARIHVFRPFVRNFGLVRGTLAGFFASGIAHEIVISIPARGGFGLPTIYFLIQVSVLLMQRKFESLQNGFITLATVLIPAPILFHPVFIERVFAPMMKLITN